MSAVFSNRWSLVTLVSFLIVSLLSAPNPSVPPGTHQRHNSDLRISRHVGDGLTAPEGEADAIAVAPDGSTYVTGTSRGDVFVARISSDGSQVLSFTYLGGSGEDAGTGIAVEGDGSILVTGSTRSADFPLRRPLQKELAGGSDAFVARLDKDGVRVLSATYLGGAGDDAALAIALDGSGGAWITGETSSRDFPVTSGAPQQAALGNGDAFVSHLNAPGNRLIESTYLGGAGRDQGLAIGVDSEGRVVVAGATASIDFPIVSRVNAAQSVYGGDGAEGLGDAFVAALIPGSRALAWSTYLGGAGDDSAHGLALDPDGGIYLAGRTTSGDFPTQDAFQPTPDGGSDGFVARLEPDGGGLVFSSYLGGAGEDSAEGIVLDGHRSIVVAGSTTSTGIGSGAATQGGARQESDLFVIRVALDGTRITREAIVGGSDDDHARTLALGARGDAWVAGPTHSSDFASDIVPGGAPGGVSRSPAGSSEPFVALISSGAAALTCPGTINFDNSSGTSLWTEPNNWDQNPARLPNSTDDVCIGPAFSITLPSGTHTINSLTSSGSLTVDGGTLTINAASTLSNLTLSGGIISGAGTLDVSGLLTWTGGRFDGPSGANSILNANGGITINAASLADFTHRTINNPGTTTWMDGNFRSGQNGVFNNIGTFKDQTIADQYIQNAYGGVATFNNIGTFEKSSATETTVTVTLNNTKNASSAALVHLLAGSLVVQAGGSSTGGTFTGDPGSTLRFNSGTSTLDGASSIGAANVVFDGGTVTMDGTYNVTTSTTFSGATVTFSAASVVTNIGPAVSVSSGAATMNSGNTLSPTTITMSGGILGGSDQINVSGLLTWTGGRFDGPSGANSILNANGGITINAASLADFTHRTINSPGTTTWMDGNFRSGQNGVFNNIGTFKDQTIADQYIQNAYGGVATFNNIGTFEKSSATETTVTVTLNNTKNASSAALVHLLAGSLVVQAGGSSTGGTFTGDSGSTLRFNSGTSTLDGASSIGAANVVFDGGTVTMDGTYNVTTSTTFSGATVTFSAASVVTNIGPAVSVSSGAATMNSGNTLSPTTITMSGGILGGSDQINVSGLLTWTGGRFDGPSGANSILNANGGITINAASLADFTHRTINSPGTTTWMDGNFRSGQNGVFNNIGTFKDQTIADQYIQNAYGGVATFNNIGTFEKSSATETTVTVTLNNSGTMDAKGGVLAFQNSYVQTSGTTRLTGGAISTNSSLAIQGGSLAGSGTITGNVVCSGTGQLSPGLSPGLLAIVGDYAQSGGGVDAVELGGLTAGTQFDQANLSGSGAATLGGALNVTLTGGFTPTLGDAFTIMNFVSRTGAFATQNLPALPAGLTWNVTHGSTSVVLTVSTSSSVDLALTNSDSPDPVSQGDNLTYTISISNNGPNDATGLTMTDTLPAGVSYVSATGTGWTCGHASGVVTCTRASLGASASAPLSIVVAPGAAPASLNNTAVVAGAEFDPTLSNNTDSEDTTVNPPTLSADLSIAKSDGPDPVNASAALAYTLSVSNAGPDTASSVSVTDTLPAGVAYASAVGTGWSCGHVSGVVTCTRATLAVGAAPAITINVTAPAAGGGISNTATVASATGDPMPGNNVDSEGTTVNPPTLSADLSIAKSDGPDPVNASAALTYTLSASNAGPDTASSVSVTDTLPAGVAYASAAGTGWTCGHAAGVVTCTRASLVVGAAPAITINVTAPAAGGEINNTATVASTTGDAVPGNNSDSEATLVTTASLTATVRFNPRSLNASSEGGTILGVLTLSSGALDPNTILLTQINGIPITPLHGVPSGSSGTQYKFARLEVIMAIEALLRICTTGMPITLTVSGASTTGTPFTASDTITYMKKAPCPDGAASCLAIKPPSLKMSATSVQPFLGTIGLCLGDVDPASVRITAINGDEVTPIPGVLVPGGKKMRFAFERTAVRDAYLAVAGTCPARQVASAELEVEGITILGAPFEVSNTITIVCGEGL